MSSTTPRPASRGDRGPGPPGPGASLAGPGDVVADPLLDHERLEQPDPVPFDADVVPVAQAEHEVRPVVDVVLQDREERPDAGPVRALGADQEVVREVLAPDEPARPPVPE